MPVNDYDTNMKFPLVKIGQGDSERQITPAQAPAITRFEVAFISFCAGMIGGIGFTLICVAHHLWR